MATLRAGTRPAAGPYLDTMVEHALGAVVSWDIGDQPAVDYQAWLDGQTVEVAGGPAVANPAWLHDNRARGPQYFTPRRFSSDETLTCWLLNEIRERGWDVVLIGNGTWTVQVTPHGDRDKNVLAHVEDPSLPYAVSLAFVEVVGLDRV